MQDNPSRHGKTDHQTDPFLRSKFQDAWTSTHFYTSAGTEKVNGSSKNKHPFKDMKLN